MLNTIFFKKLTKTESEAPIAPEIFFLLFGLVVGTAANALL